MQHLFGQHDGVGRHKAPTVQQYLTLHKWEPQRHLRRGTFA